MNAFRISIVLPAYNEEANIYTVVQSCHAFLSLSQKVSDFRIVIVNDGSKDNTGEIIDTLAVEHDQVVAVHQPNGGYGSALRKGFVTAATLGQEWIFFMDSDQQFKIEDIERLFALIQAGCDFAAGWRINRADTFDRKIKGKLWSLACATVLGQFFYDIDCAFKLFRLEHIGDPTTLIAEGSTINAELILRARERGARFGRVGIPHHPRGGGKSSCTSMSFIAQSVISLIKLRARIFANNHNIQWGQEVTNEALTN